MISSPPDRASPQAALAERLLRQLPGLPLPPSDRMIDAANAAYLRHKRRVRLRTALLAALSPALALLLSPLSEPTGAAPTAALAAPAPAPKPEVQVEPPPPRALATTHEKPNSTAEELVTLPHSSAAAAPPAHAAARGAGRARRAHPAAPQAWARAGAQATVRPGAPVHAELLLQGGLRVGERGRVGVQASASPRQQVLRDEAALHGAELSAGVGLWMQPRGPLSAGLLLEAASRWYPVDSAPPQRDLLTPALAGELGLDVPLGPARVLHPTLGVSRDLTRTFVRSGAEQVNEVSPTRFSLGLSLSIPAPKNMDPIVSNLPFVEDCQNCRTVQTMEQR